MGFIKKLFVSIIFSIFLSWAFSTISLYLMLNKAPDYFDKYKNQPKVVKTKEQRQKELLDQLQKLSLQKTKSENAEKEDVAAPFESLKESLFSEENIEKFATLLDAHTFFDEFKKTHTDYDPCMAVCNLRTRPRGVQHLSAALSDDDFEKLFQIDLEYPDLIPNNTLFAFRFLNNEATYAMFPEAIFEMMIDARDKRNKFNNFVNATKGPMILRDFFKKFVKMKDGKISVNLNFQKKFDVIRDYGQIAHDCSKDTYHYEEYRNKCSELLTENMMYPYSK